MRIKHIRDRLPLFAMQRPPAHIGPSERGYVLGKVLVSLGCFLVMQWYRPCYIERTSRRRSQNAIS